MDYNYNIFGSGDSTDYDIVIAVKSLANIEQNKQTILEIENILKIKFNNKPVNCNIAVFENGVVKETHKGTPDELNNSILRTYSLHKQDCDCLVIRMLPRNVDLKIARIIRTILTFSSRTKNRIGIKNALKSDNNRLKLYTVKDLDFEEIFNEGLGEKNITKTHFFKKTAFQLIQGLGLILDKQEYYTKQEMVYSYPKLKAFLYEERLTIDDISYLDNLKTLFCSIVKHKYLDTFSEKI